MLLLTLLNSDIQIGTVVRNRAEKTNGVSKVNLRCSVKASQITYDYIIIYSMKHYRLGKVVLISLLCRRLT